MMVHIVVEHSDVGCRVLRVYANRVDADIYKSKIENKKGRGYISILEFEIR